MSCVDFRFLFKTILRKLLSLVLLGLPWKIYTQEILVVPGDSLLLRDLERIEKTTDGILENPDRFISGKLYVPRGTMDNHPYFKDFVWKPGSISFQNELFPVKMMKYDIELDALIVMKTFESMGYPIRLNEKLVREFTIDDRHFEFIDSVSKPGYYETVYLGQTDVWARYKKTNSNSMKGAPKYASSVRFIIRVDGSYIEIKNLHDLYRLFTDKETELRTFKRQNRLSFAADKTGTIHQLVQYYDTINP